MTDGAGERLRFAEALSRDGRAHLIDGNNQMAGIVDLASAVEDDRAFFIDVEDDKLAVDFDRADARVAALRLKVELLIMGYRSFITASGGDDRRHLFATIADPFDLEHAAAIARGLGGDVRRAIRPPGAKHRRGGRSKVQAEDEHDAAEILEEGVRLKPLGQRGVQALRDESAPDRSQHLYAIACSAANAGWTYGDLLFVASTPGNGAHVALEGRIQDRGRRTTERWLEHQVWRSAVAFVADNPARSEQDTEKVGRLLAWQEGRAWTGASGPLHRAVFLAFVKIYSRCSVEPFTASTRDIAEQAGISRRSVRSATRALAVIGIINPESGLKASRPDFRGTPGQAWSFNDAMLDGIPGMGHVAALVHLSHDLFRHAELGKTGQFVYDTLARDPGASAAWISALTGLAPRRVVRALKRLEVVGVVYADSRGGWALTGLEPDVVAKELATAPHGARQRDLHGRERRAYKGSEPSVPQLPTSGGVGTSWGTDGLESESDGE